MPVDMKKLAAVFKTSEKTSKPTQDDVVEFLKENPNPEDELLHDWAEGKGFDVSKVEALMYELATLYAKILSGGKAQKEDVKEKDVDKDELKKGIEVEKEHTGDKGTAEEIVLDHLAEIPDYYTKLKKMEENG